MARSIKREKISSLRIWFRRLKVRVKILLGITVYDSECSDACMGHPYGISLREVMRKHQERKSADI